MLPAATTLPTWHSAWVAGVLGALRGSRRLRAQPRDRQRRVHRLSRAAPLAGTPGGSLTRGAPDGAPRVALARAHAQQLALPLTRPVQRQRRAIIPGSVRVTVGLGVRWRQWEIRVQKLLGGARARASQLLHQRLVEVQHACQRGLSAPARVHGIYH